MSRSLCLLGQLVQGRKPSQTQFQGLARSPQANQLVVHRGGERASHLYYVRADGRDLLLQGRQEVAHQPDTLGSYLASFSRMHSS